MRRLLLSLVLLFGLAKNGLHPSSTAATSTTVNILDAGELVQSGNNHRWLSMTIR